MHDRLDRALAAFEDALPRLVRACPPDRLCPAVSAHGREVLALANCDVERAYVTARIQALAADLLRARLMGPSGRPLHAATPRDAMPRHPLPLA
ncbi:MAG TPA: hypothetical protein VLK29_08170 [Luteimonas sp.]|nr:hypothetical protein [Luteimonas sp.]